MAASLERKPPVAANADDPWADDVLGRRHSAEFLTKLLASNEGGFVLNVDAGWGLGKTFLLERWRLSIRKDYPTVLFNAWESDFAEDPLVAFVSETTKQLADLHPPSKALLGRLAKVGGQLALSAGAAIIETGVARILGKDGVDAVKDVFSPETEAALAKQLGEAASHAIKEHHSKKQSVEAFRATLAETVTTLTSMGGFQRPIFIFVDELDRCRPTYAVSLLEKIKHLFSVPGVVFVVATNTTQLRRAICAIYGARFDAETYLRRFFDQTYRLPPPSRRKYSELLHASDELMKPRSDGRTVYCSHEGTAATMFAAFSDAFDLSLRDQEQAFVRVLAIVRVATQIRTIHYPYLCLLVMAQLKLRKPYDRWIRAGDNQQFLKALRDKFLKSDMLSGIAGAYISTASSGDSFSNRLNGLISQPSLNADEQKIRALLEAIESDWVGFPEHKRLVELTRGLER